MARYKAVIEGVFVNAPDLGQRRGGFFATFFVGADSSADAVKLLGGLLFDRLRLHSVVGKAGGALATYFVICSVEEVDEELFEEYGNRDLGFSFFYMKGLDVPFLFLRGLCLKWFKPVSLIRLDVVQSI